MSEKVLKKYYEQNLGDLPDRRVRVWYKIDQHLKQSEESPEQVGLLSYFQKLSLAPLVLAVLLTVVGAGAVQSFSGVMPGDKLYSVKRAAEKVQLSLVTDEQQKEDIQIHLVETRADEVTKLEQKVQNDNNPQTLKTIDQIKIEVGQQALALVAPKKSDPSSASSTPGSSLVQAAEAKVVGEAAIQFLKSTPLSGKQKYDALKLVILQAKQDSETKPADTTGSEQIDPVVKGASTIKPADNPTSSTTPTIQIDNKTDGQIKSGADTK